MVHSQSIRKPRTTNGRTTCIEPIESWEMVDLFRFPIISAGFRTDFHPSAYLALAVSHLCPFVLISEPSPSACLNTASLQVSFTSTLQAAPLCFHPASLSLTHVINDALRATVLENYLFLDLSEHQTMHRSVTQLLDRVH